MVSARSFSQLLLVAALCCSGASAQRGTDTPAEREARHASVEWQMVAPHLPDLGTATPAALETAGDVLRARRLPEDAIGNPSRLLNRIGVTELELHRPTPAQMAFRQILATDPGNAEAWNNLGATEYSMGNYTAALSDYRKAVKLNKKDAVFHSNLGMAYFEQKDFDSARGEFVRAVKLDPDVFQRGGWGGVDAHVMSPQDRGRFCVELARLAAGNHNEDAMLLWLARASEAGYDIRYDMQTTRELIPYLHDPRVSLLISNAKAMRPGQIAGAGSGPVPTLPAEAPRMN